MTFVPDYAPAMTSKWANGSAGPAGDECQNLVAHSLRGEGFDASEDGTGRGTPLVPVAFDPRQITSRTNRSNPSPGAPCHTLHASAPVLAFRTAGDGAAYEEGEVTAPLTTGTDTSANVVLERLAVRRLTPRECERLQGFPDDYTRIERRGKPAADGPRYRAIGNSMAVNVMRWIGTRIQMMEDISE